MLCGRTIVPNNLLIQLNVCALAENMDEEPAKLKFMVCNQAIMCEAIGGLQPTTHPSSMPNVHVS